VRERLAISDFLDSGEDILWKGQAPLAKVIALLALMSFAAIATWWLAIINITAAQDCAASVADACPRPDRRSGLMLILGPVGAVVLALPVPFMLFVRNQYAITNKRILHLHTAPWRRPKFTQVPMTGASARLEGAGLIITVIGGERGHRVTLMAMTLSQARSALDLIQTLSCTAQTTKNSVMEPS
jgi:hypothetical protein